MRKWRILGLIILCAAVMFLPSAVSASEKVSSGTCGDNLVWMLDSEGTLTISGTGEMNDFGPLMEHHGIMTSSKALKPLKSKTA